MAFLIRDQFTTAINPLVDAAADPGPGNRDVTGSLWKIIDGSLRGGMQPSSPTWGNSKIVYDGVTRADGVALWAILQTTDKRSDFGFGWASTTAVTDPRTDGHHWIQEDGFPRLSVPGTEMTLSGIGSGTEGVYRNDEYLIGVVLRAQGAFYLMSSHTAHTAAGVGNSNDRPGIPAYPSARVLWVDDAATTTPMYPHISALNQIGPTHLHYIEDLRVQAVSSWATDAGIATYLDRFTRADSTTSAGSAYTVVSGGVGGVSSNKGYVVSNSGARTVIVNPSAASSGDGIWKWRVTVGSTPSQQLECFYRYVNSTNYCHVVMTSTSIWVYINNAGSDNPIFNYPLTKSAGQVLDITINTSGAYHQMFVYEGSTQRAFVDWTADPGGSQRTGTGMGFGSWAVAPAGARWDDLMFTPSIITLPAEMQTGAAPHQFTVGSTLVTDDFTAADGTALAGRTTTTGGKTWAVAGTGWQINSNKARNTNVGGAGADYFAWFDSGASDVEVSVDVTFPASFDTVHAGIVIRRTDANNFLHIRFVEDPGQPFDDEIEIWETVGGTTLDTVRHQFGDVFTGSMTRTLKVQAVGRYIHCFMNNEPICSYVTSGNLTGTGVGLHHAGDDDGSVFDAFTVKALTDPAAVGPAAVLAADIVAGSAVAASQLSLNHALAANVAASSAMTATRLTMNHALAAGIAAGSAATADKIVVNHPMSAAIVAGSSGVADLTVSGSGASLAAGIVIGSAVTASALTILHPLTAGIVAGSAATATKITVSHPLIATVTAVSSMTANRLTMSQAMQAAISAIVTISAGIDTTYGEFTGTPTIIDVWAGVPVIS